jgi:hypothetical protein
VLLACLAPLALTAAALLQGGYTTEKHPELGLTFPRARDYEQVPIPPDEEFIVLYFTEKIPEKPRKGDDSARERMRPELNVVWIDEGPDRAPATADATPPPPADGSKPAGGSATAGDKKAKPPINSLERWVEQRLPGWQIAGEPKEGRTKKGWGAREYELKRKQIKGRPSQSGRGWIYAWRGPGRTVAFVGAADEADFARHVEFWRESAEKVDLDEPEEASTAKLERKYGMTKLREIPFRIEARKKLVRGWKAEDTENFIVVYHTPDVPLVRKIVGDLEVIRKEYEKLFPAAQPVTAVSTVRICKDEDEYLAYGGNPGTAGYWNWSTEELVLYDAEKELRGGGKSDADTFLVLYHEAFHQYIYYSTGEVPPHSWFNEGHGDFFSGARVRDGKVRGIGPNPWRTATIQYMVSSHQSVPWSEIIHYEQPQYYANPGLCYAQGWAMVYFLRTSPLVEKKPEWARILPTYFDTLKAAWGEELTKLAAAGKKDDRVERFKSGLEARKKACAAAFEGVDLDAIDAAWREFVVHLDVPKSK